MKKMIKKMFAILTAFTAAAVMTVPVSGFAVNSPTADAAPAHKLETSTEIATIPIKKDILAFNSENKRIFEPNIVYSYSVESAAVTNASISTKDQNGGAVVLAVRPGVIEAITAINDSGDADATMAASGTVRTGTITFKSDHSDADMRLTNKISDTPYQCSSDYTFRKQMDIIIDASKIYDVPNAQGEQDGEPDNGPGVYRYKLTDITSNETYTQSGVTEGLAGDELYLDVYTKNNDANNGLVIYGYVLLKSTTDGGNTSITYNEEATEELKVEGFVTVSEGDDDGNGTVIPADFKGDKYVTYNVNIKELVAGDLADRQHEFPFHIELSNGAIKSCPDFSINDGTTHRNTCLDADGAWDSEVFHTADAAASETDPTRKTIDFNLKYNEMISLIGLPASTMVLVTEKNDTNDNYAVSAIYNQDTSQTLINSAGDKTGTSISITNNDTAAMTAAVEIKLQKKADEIVITNTLTDISVTGLLFDIAPFIFMTAAGMILLIVFLRNRKRNHNENMI